MKDVKVVARIQFKNNVGHVAYRVLSSNGKTTYTVCLLDDSAGSCTCEGNALYHKHCYHMSGCEQLERARVSKSAPAPVAPIAARHLAPLNGNRAFSILR